MRFQEQPQRSSAGEQKEVPVCSPSSRNTTASTTNSAWKVNMAHSSFLFWLIFFASLILLITMLMVLLLLLLVLLPVTQRLWNVWVTNPITTSMTILMTLVALMYHSMQQLRSCIKCQFFQVQSKIQHQLEHVFLLDDFLHQSIGFASILISFMMVYALPISQSFRREIMEMLYRRIRRDADLDKDIDVDAEWKRISQILYQPGGLYTLYQWSRNYPHEGISIIDHERYDEKNEENKEMKDKVMVWNHPPSDLEWNHDIPMIPVETIKENQNTQDESISMHTTDSESDMNVTTADTDKWNQKEPIPLASHPSSHCTSYYTLDPIGKHFLSWFVSNTHTTINDYEQKIRYIGILSGLLLGLQVKYSPVARTCLKNTVQRTMVLAFLSVFLGSIGSLYWKKRIWDAWWSTITIASSSNRGDHHMDNNHKKQEKQKATRIIQRSIRDILMNIQIPRTIQWSNIRLPPIWDQYLRKWKEDDEFRRKCKGALCMVVLYVFRQGYMRKDKGGPRRRKFKYKSLRS